MHKLENIDWNSDYNDQLHHSPASLVENTFFAVSHSRFNPRIIAIVCLQIGQKPMRFIWIRYHAQFILIRTHTTIVSHWLIVAGQHASIFYVFYHFLSAVCMRIAKLNRLCTCHLPSSTFRCTLIQNAAFLCACMKVNCQMSYNKAVLLGAVHNNISPFPMYMYNLRFHSASKLHGLSLYFQ